MRPIGPTKETRGKGNHDEVGLPSSCDAVALIEPPAKPLISIPSFMRRSRTG